MRVLPSARTDIRRTDDSWRAGSSRSRSYRNDSFVVFQIHDVDRGREDPTESWTLLSLRNSSLMSSEISGRGSAVPANPVYNAGLGGSLSKTPRTRARRDALFAVRYPPARRRAGGCGRMVAQGGIEPPTRGFSVRCSTN